MPSLFAPLLGRFTCVLTTALVIAACGGATTGGAPTTTNDLSCLSTLAAHCCDLETRGGAACVPDFDGAHACAAWPAGNALAIYATPCHGLVAVRAQAATYASIYVYDANTRALLAIGDNAAMSTGSTEIACGAGPAGFRIPGDCSAAWLVGTGAAACDPNGATEPAAQWCPGVDAGAE